MRFIVALALMTATAHAQQGDPSEPLNSVSRADRIIIQSALEKLLKDEPAEAERITGVLRNVAGTVPFGPRDSPMVGLALSRASAKPEACALLIRLYPAAICVK